MAKLTIKRQNTYPDLLRNYQVIINNKIVGQVANNSIVEFDNIPYNATVQLKIDWCYSNIVQLNQLNENNVILLATPSCTGFKFIFFYLFYITFLRKKYIVLKNITCSNNADIQKPL
ncbi:hypothetical protein C8P70_10960 [Myroides indicus]|uniref:Uncharacterized protein n=2 Tax=Myroides indicus TaxID=1323422 RepID=A0A4R7F6Q2_9FLAO|nr:hypothetical protein C8P70_10960 [Myroides indicus]